MIRKRKWAGADGTFKTAWQADFGTVNGKRLMRSFETKADAENWLREQRLVLGDQGHAGFSLTDAERMDAVIAGGWAGARDNGGDVRQSNDVQVAAVPADRVAVVEFQHVKRDPQRGVVAYINGGEYWPLWSACLRSASSSAPTRAAD